MKIILFLLCDLDEDIEKQQKLLDLKEEIPKYFACSTISSFKPNFDCKRPYLNIIRSILRKQQYIDMNHSIGSEQKKTNPFFVKNTKKESLTT